METIDIVNALQSKPKGGFFTVVTQRPAKVRKDCSDEIVKRSTFQGMLSDYSSRAAVKVAVVEGTRNAPQLPSHIERTFKVGKTKFWLGKVGSKGEAPKTYLPICITGNPAQIEWFLNGRECKRNEIETHLLASELVDTKPKSELAEKGQVPFVAVDIRNIVEIH